MHIDHKQKWSNYPKFLAIPNSSLKKASKKEWFGTTNLTRQDNFRNKHKIWLSLRLSHGPFVEHLEGTFLFDHPQMIGFWSLFTDPNHGFSFKTVVGSSLLRAPDLAFTSPKKTCFFLLKNPKSRTSALLQWTEKLRRWKWSSNFH